MRTLQYFGDYGEINQLDGVQFWVPEEISSKSEIFSAYGVGLSAPNRYFGENWDAFNDCLLDLQWIEKTDIFIIHRDLPRLSLKDTSIYLDILQHSAVIWADEKSEELHRFYTGFVPHQLNIFFPKELENLISVYIVTGDAQSPPSSIGG